MERRVRRKETSATTRRDDARVAGLCPILDGRALTCASPDHHFTSRMAAQRAPWNQPGSPASLPKLKVGARPASASYSTRSDIADATVMTALLRLFGVPGLGRLRERRRIVRQAVEID